MREIPSPPTPLPAGEELKLNILSLASYMTNAGKPAFVFFYSSPPPAKGEAGGVRKLIANTYLTLPATRLP